MWLLDFFKNLRMKSQGAQALDSCCFCGVHLVGFRGFNVWGLGRSVLHLCFAFCSVVVGHFRFQGRVSPEVGLSSSVAA